ncbi:MAG: hypothetical protein GF309_14670 [Candidatus Lokiarchaeota archaeon]|nr:hypothetical protein [Candidatus Lokiarchaeota archaeon]
MDFRSVVNPDSRNQEYETNRKGESQKCINLAPLKGMLESDPVRSKVLRLLIEDGGWVSTTDLLKAARKARPLIGAVTIGTILTSINQLVSSRLVLSRTSLSSGIEWAEWRLNPDWIRPTRKLIQMLSRRQRRLDQGKRNQRSRSDDDHQ